MGPEDPRSDFSNFNSMLTKLFTVLLLCFSFVNSSANSVYDNEVFENSVWKEICAEYTDALKVIKEKMKTPNSLSLARRKLIISAKLDLMREYNEQLNYLYSLKLQSKVQVLSLIRQRARVIERINEMPGSMAGTQTRRNVIARLVRIKAQLQRIIDRQLIVKDKSNNIDQNAQSLVNQFQDSLDVLRGSIRIKEVSVKSIAKILNMIQ